MPPSTDQPTTNINRLGVFIDGYAVLINAHSDLVPAIRASLNESLAAAQSPELTVRQITANVGLLTETRPYTLLSTAPGASTTIYVGAQGKNFYAAWRTYVKPTINRRMITVMVIVAAALAVIITLLNLITPLAAILYGIATLITILLLEIIPIAAAGFLIRRNPLSFFLVEPNAFDAEDITTMSMTAHHALINALAHSGIPRDTLRPKAIFTSRPNESV